MNSPIAPSFRFPIGGGGGPEINMILPIFFFNILKFSVYNSYSILFSLSINYILVLLYEY